MRNPTFIKIIITLLLLFLFYSGASIWISSNYLVVHEYELQSSKVSQELRIALLSDLHDHEFGEKNEKLITKVLEQDPDLVFMAGDFLNEDSVDSEIPCELIRELSQQVSVYFALGNHEIVYMEKRGQQLRRELEDAGAVVLDKDYVDLEIQGDKIRLGGMYDYAFGLDGNDDAYKAPQDVKEYLQEFQETDNLKIMMAHRPESFVLGNAAKVWDIDLVVSGHIHGGQVVLPFVGGIYGADQGWFPEYVHGLYEKENMQFLITGGLGSSSEVLPRYNNPPEIGILKIDKQ